MSYEDEMEHRRHEEKAKLVKEIIDKVNVSLDQHLERQKALEAEKRESRRKGVGSGLDEATHEIARQLALEVLREDEEIRRALKEHVRGTFRKTLLPLLGGDRDGA